MITQYKRRTSDSLDNEKFRNRMLSIVNKAAVNQALIELITRRNLLYRCVEWPEFHALISCFDYVAVPGFLPKSYALISTLIKA